LVARLSLLVALLAGCSYEVCPEGSMLDSEGDLEVTAAEHATGWGEAECSACHVRAVLHRQGCTADADLDAVREIVDAAEDDAVCMDCHGTNGVTP
jgi:hypothetical protein